MLEALQIKITTLIVSAMGFEGVFLPLAATVFVGFIVYRIFKKCGEKLG